LFSIQWRPPNFATSARCSTCSHRTPMNIIVRYSVIINFCRDDCLRYQWVWSYWHNVMSVCLRVCLSVRLSVCLPLSRDCISLCAYHHHGGHARITRSCIITSLICAAATAAAAAAVAAAAVERAPVDTTECGRYWNRSVVLNPGRSQKKKCSTGANVRVANEVVETAYRNAAPICCLELTAWNGSEKTFPAGAASDFCSGSVFKH